MNWTDKESMKTLMQLSCLIATAAVLSACSFDASIVEAPQLQAPDVVISKAGPRDIVSGSKQNIQTSGHYKVSASVNFHSGPPQFTTSGGYKVTTSVQGTLEQ